MLLLNQAVSLRSPCLSKEKHSISSFYLSDVTENLQHSSRSREPLPRATEWDCLTPECNPMAQGFWRIHYTALSLLPTEQQAVKKGWYKLDVLQLLLPGCWRRWWMSSSLCGCVWAWGYALLGLWQRGQMQNWGAGISLSQSVRPLTERYGNIWDITSDWQLIPTWESMRQNSRFVCVDGRLPALMELSLSLSSSPLMPACNWMNIIQGDDSEPAVSAGMFGWGCWHIVEFFNSTGGAGAWFSFQVRHLLKLKQKQNPVFSNETPRWVWIKIFQKGFWGDISRTPRK